tara:strand:+ start:272 stop:532 length:261 start_codon:yes stop_codon:yes gene_type:complete
MITALIQNVAKGMVARRLIGGGKDATKNISAQDYLKDVVAERVSLDEYMRTTNVTGKTKGKSFAAKSVSPESGIMAYRRAVEKMRS